MNGLLNNPLLAIGSGLLSASGPSLNPGGVSLGRGLSMGLNNMNAMQTAALERQMAQERIQMQRQKMAMERAKMQQAQAAEAQKQRAIQGLLGGIQDPAKRTQIESLIQINPGAAIKMLQPPEPGEQWSQPYLDNSTGKPMLLRRNLTTGKVESVGSGGVNVSTNVLPDPVYRNTPGGGTVAILPKPDGTFDTRQIIPDAPPKPPEEDPAAKAARTQRAKTEETWGTSYKIGTSLIDDYAKAASEAQGPLGVASPGKVSTAKAESARDALVAWWAKNVLGTPGAEPNTDVYRRAEEAIPDFSGPLDAYRLPGLLQSLKKTAASSLAQRATTPAPPVPPPPPGAFENPQP